MWRLHAFLLFVFFMILRAKVTIFNHPTKLFM